MGGEIALTMGNYHYFTSTSAYHLSICVPPNHVARPKDRDMIALLYETQCLCPLVVEKNIDPRKGGDGRVKISNLCTHVLFHQKYRIHQ